MSEFGSPSEAEIVSSSGESSPRFRKAIDTLTRTVVSRIEEKGFENLPNIPRGAIFAVNHERDVYVPILASALAAKRDIAVTHISTQNMQHDPLTKIGITLAGNENFIPINYGKVEGTWQPGMIQPEDYRKVTEVTMKGKDVVIASGNPPSTGRNERPGLAQVLAAQEILRTGRDAVVVPVSVSIEGKEEIGNAGARAFLETLRNRFNKPIAKVQLGEPMKLEAIDMTGYDVAMQKRQSGEKLTEQELDAFHTVKIKLQEQAQHIVDVQQQLTSHFSPTD